jgi:hypothetical protein
VPAVTVVRFPLEKVRQPGETKLEPFSRKLAAFRAELAEEIARQRARVWAPPSLGPPVDL